MARAMEGGRPERGEGGRQPNDPGCANFASILRTVLFGAISTQNYYVSTLCVEFARIITFAIFAQFRLLCQRLHQNCAKKRKKFARAKKWHA